jgi:hypothetical protein
LGLLFSALIDQSGYNRRLRALAPQISRCINYLTLPQPFPLVLGLLALSALRRRRDADRLGTGARIGLRLLALAAGIWHNHINNQPSRAFAAYGR